MSNKRKRRLSENEITELRQLMESAGQGHKPTIGQLARYFGVNKPSIIKSLGGWKGIQRGKPTAESNRRSQIDRDISSPATIDTYTTSIPEELKT